MQEKPEENQEKFNQGHWFIRWLRKSRLKSSLFILTGIFEAIMAGILGAVLFFGILGQGVGLTTMLGGLLFFFIVVIVRTQRIKKEALGQAGKARFIKRAHIVSGSLIALILCVAILTQLYSLGFWPFTVRGTGPKAYKASFERLVSAMGSTYPYFQVKRVNWDELTSRYRQKLETVNTDAEYTALLADMLGELNDGHTGVTDPWPGSDLMWLANVRVIEGKPVVSAVRKTIKVPGFQPGAIIVARDGLSVDDWVLSLPLPMKSASTPWAAKAKAYGFICAIPKKGRHVITYKTPWGETMSATFEWKDVYLSGSQSQSEGSASDPAVKGKMLPSGVGLITVNRLWGSSGIVKEFDKVLSGMMNAKGIILDLRDNGGGNSLYGDAMADRFMSKKFTYGQEYFRRRLFSQAFTKKSTYSLHPRKPVYEGPLVVLTDVNTFSSAELMTAALKDSGRAITLGRTTGGGSGNPIGIRVPGGSVRFSTGDFRRFNGTLIEGCGIEPDVPVNWTVQDVLLGKDPDILAAERYILDLGK